MKKILLITIFFILGFLSHALLFPDFLANGIVDVQQIVLPKPTTAQQAQTNDFITKVTYDGKNFSRHNIKVQFGSYLLITNISKDRLMWLESNNPLLATKRGYAESEAIRVRMDEKGQFLVTDKTNPQEKLVITVK